MERLGQFIVLFVIFFGLLFFDGCSSSDMAALGEPDYSVGFPAPFASVSHLSDASSFSWLALLVNVLVFLATFWLFSRKPIDWAPYRSVRITLTVWIVLSAIHLVISLSMSGVWIVFDRIGGLLMFLYIPILWLRLFLFPLGFLVVPYSLIIVLFAGGASVGSIHDSASAARLSMLGFFALVTGILYLKIYLSKRKLRREADHNAKRTSV